jgi:hypothetical protein
MKLCKDCKHCEIKKRLFSIEYNCNYFYDQGPSPVHGEIVRKGPMIPCEIGREYMSKCGPEGKLWEAK